jgi:hypothetical protein
MLDVLAMQPTEAIMSVQSLNKTRLNVQPLKLMALVLSTSLIALWLISFVPKMVLSPSLLTSPSFSMSSSGALTLYLSSETYTANISCASTTLSVTMPAREGLPGYELSFVSPIQLDKLEQNALIDINQTNQLSFSLIDQKAQSYAQFQGSNGELSFNPITQKGTLSAFLVDSSSQQLFLNASWSCL